MTTPCPYCGHRNIVGTDQCEKCLHSFMQKDLPQPQRDSLQRDIMTLRMKDFIPGTPAITVRADTTVQEAIEKLQATPQHGCVLVCDAEGCLVGIVSIRDILHRVAGVIKDPARSSVSKIMTAHPATLDQDAPLAFALHKMSIGRFRHIPIVQDKKPIGVVALRDIIPYLLSRK